MHDILTMVIQVWPGQYGYSKRKLMVYLPSEVVFLREARVHQEFPIKNSRTVPAPNLTVVVSKFYFFPIEGICVKQPKVLQWSVQLTQAPIQGK